MSDYQTTLTIARTPPEVFAAILDTRRWWNESIEGATTAPSDEFRFDVKGLHRTRIRVIEVAPHRRIEWHVVDNAFGFVEDQTEWIGNRLVFELEPDGDLTRLTFTQHGLVPEYECYDVCSTAWGFFIGESLRSLVELGEGKPESAQADKEDVPREEFFQTNKTASRPG